MGVTEIQFAKAMEAGYRRREVNKKVLDQIIACDDFLTFKKLMVKRNIELEFEVIAAMKRPSVEQDVCGTKHEDLATYDGPTKSAASLSSNDSNDAGKCCEGFQHSQEVEDDNTEDAQNLKDAMRANLLEMEFYTKQMELEQAELEKALAISLKLEEDRLAKLEGLKREQDDVKNLEKELERAETELSKERAMHKEKSRALVEESKRQLQEENEFKAPQEIAMKSERKSPRKETTRSGNLSGPKVALRPVISSVGKSAGSEGGKKSYSFSPLPDIAVFQKKKNATLGEFRKNREEIQKRKDDAIELRRQAHISEDEVETRAAYLRKQREKMLEKKKREREKNLQKFEENKLQERRCGKDDILTSKAKEFRQTKVSSTQSVKEAENINESMQKRRLMVMSLGLQMKKDLLDEEDERNDEKQVEQFSLLDEQLREAERLRQQRRQQHNLQVDRIRQDKLIRAMNVQSSSFANRIVHGEQDFSFKEQ